MDFLLLLTAAVAPRWVGFSFIDMDQFSRKVLVKGGENLSDGFKNLKVVETSTYFQKGAKFKREPELRHLLHNRGLHLGPSALAVHESPRKI